MSSRKFLLVFLLILTIYLHAELIKVSKYTHGYVSLLNEDGKVFLEFTDEKRSVYRKNFVFFGKAYDCAVYNARIFVVGSSSGQGALYVCDLTGVAYFRQYGKEIEILQVIPAEKGLFLIGKQKIGYTIMLTDFYGHIVWKRGITERSDFIKALIGRYLHVVFERSVYTLDMRGNLIHKENYIDVSSAFLKDDGLYIIFNKKGYSITQDGRIFLEDVVEDVCVQGKDVYIMGRKGVWKNEELLLKGSFRGINCVKDCIIIWTDHDFFSLKESER